MEIYQKSLSKTKKHVHVITLVRILSPVRRFKRMRQKW